MDTVRKVAEALAGFEAEDQELILRWARELVGLSEPPPRPRTAAHSPPSPDEPPTPAQTPDIRTFHETKKPSSDTQFAAVVAYYYRFEAVPDAQKDSITKEDLQEACRQVGRKRLKYPAQTLVNAHRQGFLDRGERGAYAINTVGENLVAMALPSDNAAALSGRTRKRSGRATTATKTKGSKQVKRRTATKKRAR
ncbi:MAG: hypothetical protein WD359_07205 [Dehalococcoidia bacterium]